MTLAAARATIMAGLARCPVCGAAVLEAEKSDNLETVSFECEAAFYLQAGSIIAVSRICSSPSHVAVRHLEAQAASLAAKEAA
jgi:hypothetical protein